MRPGRPLKTEPRRPARVAVQVRITEPEAQALDEARGEESRAEFARRALLRALPDQDDPGT